jgi:hypothetical protein
VGCPLAEDTPPGRRCVPVHSRLSHIAVSLP